MAGSTASHGKRIRKNELFSSSFKSVKQAVLRCCAPPVVSEGCLSQFSCPFLWRAKQKHENNTTTLKFENADCMMITSETV